MAGRLVEDLLRDLKRLARMGARPRDLATDPGAWILATYRVGRVLRSLPRPLGLPLLALHRPWEAVVQAVTRVSLPGDASIGGGLYLGHVGAIRIDSGVHLGRDVNLSYGVVITAGGTGDQRGLPFIGDRVHLGPGARVTGNVRIGNDAVIAANAVVDFDVPDGAVVGVAPARASPAAEGVQAAAARGSTPPHLEIGSAHRPRPRPGRTARVAGS